MLSVGQWAHNSLLTRWSPPCSSLNGYGCLSSHSSLWWWRRGNSMGVQSAATTKASINHIEACTRSPASWADFAFRFDRGRNLLVPPLVGAASPTAKRARVRGWVSRANGWRKSRTRLVPRVVYWFERGFFLVLTGMPRPVLGESYTTSIKDFSIFPHQKKRINNTLFSDFFAFHSVKW